MNCINTTPPVTQEAKGNPPMLYKGKHTNPLGSLALGRTGRGNASPLNACSKSNGTNRLAAAAFNCPDFEVDDAAPFHGDYKD